MRKKNALKKPNVQKVSKDKTTTRFYNIELLCSKEIKKNIE